MGWLGRCRLARDRRDGLGPRDSTLTFSLGGLPLLDAAQGATDFLKMKNTYTVGVTSTVAECLR